MKTFVINRWGRRTVCYVVGPGLCWEGAHFTKESSAKEYEELNGNQVEEKHKKD